MENVPLRSDALQQLDLPLHVKAGFVGHIKLSIPVQALWSKPWSITMEQLYLVAAPLSSQQVTNKPSLHLNLISLPG